MARKSSHEEDDEMREDDDREEDLEEDEDDEDDDTIGLDEAEEEEDDEDDDEDEDGSADDLERKRLFQGEAEEILENLTLEDVKEVLGENELDLALAPKLKKLLAQVIAEGEVTSMDDAWDEALERLQE